MTVTVREGEGWRRSEGVRVTVREGEGWRKK